MPLLEDLAAYIEGEGIAHRTDPAMTGGWKLSMDVMPAEPDFVVKLGSAGGPGPREKNAAGAGVELARQRQVQVVVRGDRYGGAAARTKLQEVFDALHNLPRMTLGTTQVAGIRVFSDVISLGLDDNRRPELALNFLTTTGG